MIFGTAARCVPSSHELDREGCVSERRGYNNGVRAARLLVCLLGLLAIPARSEALPPYPLEHEYTQPKVRELGTIPGQIRGRLFTGVALGDSRSDARVATSLAAQWVFEVMGNAFVGVRTTGFGSLGVPIAGEAPQWLSLRVGPSFHFLPFRRVDLGTYLDGGFAVLDLVQRERTWAPALGAGGTLDISLTSYLALHMETGVQGGVFPTDASAHTHWLLSGLFGFGITL